MDFVDKDLSLQHWYFCHLYNLPSEYTFMKFIAQVQLATNTWCYKEKVIEMYMKD